MKNIFFTILFFASQNILAEQSTAIKVYERVAKSVVIVKSANSRVQSQGSGVAIGYGYSDNKPSSTWVVTNAHVIANVDNVEVESQGKRYKADVQYIDYDNDIAELLIRNNMLHALSKLNGIEKIDAIIGERVYAVGSPLGLENSISEGIVSGKREKNGVKLIQTTAAISSGNSGGGLFNENGELLGITTFKIKNAENINFAIDSGYLKAIQDALLASVIFSMSMNIQESNELTKWILSNKAENGELIYKYILRVNEDGLRQKGDFFGYVKKYYLPLFDGYKVTQVEKSKQRVEAEISTKKLKINCTLKSLTNPQVLREKIFVLDEENQKVEGYENANFSDSEISFSSGDVRFILGRYSGILSATNKNSQPYVLGPCTRVNDRAF